MNGIVPLLLMWMISRTSGTSAAPAIGPAWPTAASPPPPIPAFVPQQPSADTGTPLATLHTAAKQAAKPAPKPKAAAPRPKAAAARPKAAVARPKSAASRLKAAIPRPKVKLKVPRGRMVAIP